MIATDLLRLLANVTILYVGIVLALFIIGYAFFFNWRKTSGGRSVMYFVSSLELLILLAAFLQWAPDLLHPETEQFLRLQVYVIIAWSATRMLWVLITRWRTTGAVEIDVDLRRPRK